MHWSLKQDRRKMVSECCQERVRGAHVSIKPGVEPQDHVRFNNLARRAGDSRIIK